MYFDQPGTPEFAVPADKADYEAERAVDVDDDGVLDITVHSPDGELDAGPATSDTDGDGTPDTVLVTDPVGDTVLYTDADGDGVADLSTEITAGGQVVVSEHTGDGQWIELERTQLGGEEPGAGVGEDDWTPAPENAVSVDPETGLWIRR